MNFSLYLTDELCFVASGLSLTLAALVALKARRTLSYWSFIGGMMLLAMVELCQGLSYSSIDPASVIFWQTLRAFAFALLPAMWLLFSVSFARTDFRSVAWQWKWALAAAFILPPATLAFPQSYFYSGMPVLNSSFTWDIPLGPMGRAFQLCIILFTAPLLVNLEGILRSSIGRIRWQVKFMVAGLAALCAVWIYLSSQALLFSFDNTALHTIHTIALLLADGLFLWFVYRSEYLNVDLYFSRASIQYSLTLLLVGAYFVAVAILTRMVRRFSNSALPLEAFVILLALMALSVLLLSDRLREQLRRFVARHFKRPVYDYRKAWMDLTEKTRSFVDIFDLCTSQARIISETLSFLSVNIWLCDETGPRLTLAGSTAFTRAQRAELERSGAAVAQLLRALQDQGGILDLRNKHLDWPADIMKAMPSYFADYPMRYILPLQTGNQRVGIITLNDDRVGGAQLSMEDQDLLFAYAAQLAASVFQIQLLEKLRESKELESFQAVSAFFIHDLKNLASRLSLTMQNLPVLYNNPEFRADALQDITHCLNRIETLCSRLNPIREVKAMNLVKADLNEVVAKALDELVPTLTVAVERDLKPLPRIFLDPEQLPKVLTNLVLNAKEAVGNLRGVVRVSTCRINHHVVLAVSDNGCGISRKFIEQSLFRPFKTTKSRGMGIGLFHSKMIVEAHHGRIEVESQEGKGSTFRVILPAPPA